jgi:hypothetical protein
MSETGSNRLPELAAQINSGHSAVLGSLTSALEQAMATGNLLLEARETIPHGGWLPWLRENCPNIPERTARHYMRLARGEDILKTATPADLNITVREAIRQLAPAAPDFPLLPTDGKCRIGFLTSEQPVINELFAIVESKKSPGYFYVAHIERLDDGTSISEMKRPVAGWSVLSLLEWYTRYPDRIDEIMWLDGNYFGVYGDAKQEALERDLDTWLANRPSLPDGSQWTAEDAKTWAKSDLTLDWIMHRHGFCAGAGFCRICDAPERNNAVAMFMRDVRKINPEIQVTPNALKFPENLTKEQWEAVMKALVAWFPNHEGEWK